VLQLLIYYKTTLTVFVLVYVLPAVLLILCIKHRLVLMRINYGAIIVGTFYGGMTLWSIYWLLFSGDVVASSCWDNGVLVCER
jgi:hypothetical protein